MEAGEIVEVGKHADLMAREVSMRAYVTLQLSTTARAPNRDRLKRPESRAAAPIYCVGLKGYGGQARMGYRNGESLPPRQPIG